MCNDHSNNLDHFDNMHFLREKWRCLDRWRIKFLWQTLLETSEIYRLWREFNYHLLWVNCFVCISKEKGLRAETSWGFPKESAIWLQKITWVLISDFPLIFKASRIFFMYMLYDVYNLERKLPIWNIIQMTCYKQYTSLFQILYAILFLF